MSNEQHEQDEQDELSSRMRLPFIVLSLSVNHLDLRIVDNQLVVPPSSIPDLHLPRRRVARRSIDEDELAGY